MADDKLATVLACGMMAAQFYMGQQWLEESWDEAAWGGREGGKIISVFIGEHKQRNIAVQ